MEDGWFSLKKERERNPFPVLEKKPKLHLLTDGESLSVGLNDSTLLPQMFPEKKTVYNQALSQLF